MTLAKLLLFLHMIGFVSWLAGLLYLPRLFVYHAGGEQRIDSDAGDDGASFA